MAFRLAARSTYPGSHPAPACNREAADSRRPVGRAWGAKSGSRRASTLGPRLRLVLCPCRSSTGASAWTRPRRGTAPSRADGPARRALGRLAGSLREVAEELLGRLKNPDIGRSLNPLCGEIGLAAAGAMAGHAGRRHKARYERRTRKVHLRSAAGAGLEMGNPSAQLSWAVDGVDRLAEVLG
jgi:hypothetical protein